MGGVFKGLGKVGVKLVGKFCAQINAIHQGQMRARYSATWLKIMCFAEGTHLLTPEGSKPIEQFKPGDWILSAPEDDPEAPPAPKQVEEVFTNHMALMNLHVGGQIIQTTEEHPFYVKALGWTKARELRVGDLLRSHDGRWLPVDDLCDSGEERPVYNLRVADYHTYFVGSSEWGFSIWAHNSCNLPAWKKLTIDWTHILPRHFPGGIYNPGRTIWQNLSKGQVANTSSAAWVARSIGWRRKHSDRHSGTIII